MLLATQDADKLKSGLHIMLSYFSLFSNLNPPKVIVFHFLLIEVFEIKSDSYSSALEISQLKHWRESLADISVQLFSSNFTPQNLMNATHLLENFYEFYLNVFFVKTPNFGKFLALIKIFLVFTF